MDEKYINIIYDILSNDKNFVKNSPVSEFVNKIKDEEYARNVYDIISNWDPNFSENTNYDQFLIKVGASETVSTSSPGKNMFMKMREDMNKKFIQEQEDRRENILKLSESETITDQNVLITEMSKLSPEELKKKEEEVTLEKYYDYEREVGRLQDRDDKESPYYDYYQKIKEVQGSPEDSKITENEERKKLKESIILERGFSKELADKLYKTFSTEDLYVESSKYESKSEKIYRDAYEDLGITPNQLEWVLKQEDDAWMQKANISEEGKKILNTFLEKGISGIPKGDLTDARFFKVMEKKIKETKEKLGKNVVSNRAKYEREYGLYEKKKTSTFKNISDNEIVKAHDEDELYYLHWFDDEEELITKGLEGGLLELASYYKEDVKNKKKERKSKEDSKLKTVWVNDNRGKVEEYVDNLVSGLENRNSYESVFYPGADISPWKTKEDLVNDILEFEYLKNESNVIKDYIGARKSKNLNEYQKKILSLVDGESKVSWLTMMYDGVGVDVDFVFDENSTIELDKDFKTLSYNMGDPGIKENIKTKYPELTPEEIQEIARDTYLIEQQNKLSEINNESLDKYISDFYGMEKDIVREAKSGYLTKTLLNKLIDDDVFFESTSSTTPENIREDLERKLSPWGYRVYLSRLVDAAETSFLSTKSQQSGVTIKVIAPDGMGEFEAPVLQQGFGGALYINNEDYISNEKNGVNFKDFIAKTSGGRKFNLANIADIKPSDSLFATQLKTNDQTLRTSIYSQNALKNRIEDAQNNLDRVSNQMLQNVSNEAMNIDYSPILDMYNINTTEFESTKQSINNQIEKIIQSGGGNEISSIQDIINSSLQGFIEGKLKTKRYSEDQLASIKQNSNQVFANVFNQLDNSLKNSSETINAMSNEIRYMQALDTKASEDYSLALAAKYRKDAKMGTKLGSLWNSFVNGAEATFTGMVSTGLDIATLASTPFVAIEAAGKKKKVYDEETGEWTTQDVTFAEEWDGLSKSAKAQTLPFLRSFSDEFGVGTTDEYSAQWAEDSFWGLALQGLAGSALPMVMSMYTGGVAGVPMFFGQAVEFQDQEIIKAQERGLLPKDMSELEKWATKAPMAVMMAILENYGARSFLTKGHVDKTNPFLVDLCRKTLKKLPKNSSYGTFLKAIDKSLSNSFARGSLRLAEGFLSEFETGFAQHMSDEAIKEIYDIFKSGDQSDIFTTSLQEGVLPFMKQAFISGLAEGVGGAKIGLIGGIQTGIQYNKYGESLSDSQYELMEAIVQGAPSRQDYINILNNRLKTDKKYTKQQYKQDLRRYDIAENTISQIPNSVTDYADRRKMFDLINEKRAVNQQIKDKDSLFNSGKKNRIKEIDAEMESIREFGSKTESKMFNAESNPNISAYNANNKSRKRVELNRIINKIQSHESGLEKLSQSEINDLISEVEALQKTFKKADNKITRKAAGELQTIVNNLKSGITSNTISMNQKMDQATQEKLSNENIGMYGNNNRETYIIDDEVIPRREFEEKLKNPEFVEKVMSGEISYSVVNASSNTVNNLKKQFPQSTSKEKPGYKIYKDGTVHLNKASLSVAKNITLAKKIAKKMGINFEVLNTKEYALVLMSKGYDISNTDGGLDLEKVNASEGFFADEDGEFGTIYINEATMRRNTSVGSHELLHGIFKKALTDGAIVTENGMNAINEFKDILKEEGNWDIIQERIDQNYRFENFGGEGLTKEEFNEWKKQSFPGGTINGNHIVEDSVKLNSKGNVIRVEKNENTYADEYLNAFSDAVVQKEIKYKKSIFDKILDWFKKIGGNKVFEQVDIENGRQLYDYVLGYSEQFKDIDGDILLEEGDITPEVKVSEVTEPVKKVEKLKEKAKEEVEEVEEEKVSEGGESLIEMMSVDEGVQERGGEDVSQEVEEEVIESEFPLPPEKITWPKIKAGIPDGKGGTLQTTGKTGNYKLIRTDQDGKPEILGTFNTLDGSIARANEYIGLKPIKKTTEEKVVKVKGQNDIEKSLKGDIKFANKVVKELDRLESIKASDGNMLWYNIFAGEKVTLEGIGTFSKADLTVDAIKRIKEYAVEKGWMKTLKPGDNIRKSISKPVDPSIKISDLRFSRSTSKDRRVEYKKQNRNNKVISKYNEDIVYEIIKEYESLVGIPKLDQIIEGNIQKLKGELYNNNIGRITIEAKKAYDKGFAVDPTTRITIEEFMSGFSVEFNELIRTYLNKVLDGQHRNVPFGAYIADNLPRRYGQILDALKKQFEGAQLTGTTEVAAEKRDLAAIEEDVVVDKIEKSLRKELGLDDEFRNRVLDKVKAIFKGKLPHPSSPEFKAKLEKEFETALFDVIREDLFGAKFNEEKNRYMYDWGLIQERLDQYAEIIYDKLPIQTLVSLNRTTWKKGELIMKPVIDSKTGEQKRMLPEESDRSRELFGYEVKDREAGNLVWTKQNSSEIKDDFINFFLNPIVSRKAMRMEGLFKVLDKEIAFDATMETVNNPEVYERMQDLYELQGINLLGNELEVIAKEINRSPGLRFSKSIREIANEIDRTELEFIFEAVDMLPIIDDKGLSLDEAIVEFSKKKYKLKNGYERILKWLYNEDQTAFGKRSKDEYSKLLDNRISNLQNEISKSNLVEDKRTLKYLKALAGNPHNYENTKSYLKNLRKHFPIELLEQIEQNPTLAGTFANMLFSFVSRASRKGGLDIRENVSLDIGKDIYALFPNLSKGHKGQKPILITADGRIFFVPKKINNIAPNRPFIAKDAKTQSEKDYLKTIGEFSEDQVIGEELKSTYINNQEEQKIMRDVSVKFEILEDKILSGSKNIDQDFNNFIKALDKAEEHYSQKLPRNRISKGGKNKWILRGNIHIDETVPGAKRLSNRGRLKEVLITKRLTRFKRLIRFS